MLPRHDRNVARHCNGAHEHELASESSALQIVTAERTAERALNSPLGPSSFKGPLALPDLVNLKGYARARGTRRSERDITCPIDRVDGSRGRHVVIGRGAGTGDGCQSILRCYVLRSMWRVCSESGIDRYQCARGPRGGNIRRCRRLLNESGYAHSTV